MRAQKDPRHSFFIKGKTKIVRRILRWYSRSARVLPWRGERNPYRVLISEIMLQQTQVSRVLEKYPAFIKRFPNFSKLAKARTSTVIRAWKGMGYNNRAIRLRRLAITVLDNHKGRLPSSVEELRALPGIGKYTAHAVACLVFDRHVPVVDTNIKRVLGRLLPTQSAKMDVWQTAELILPGRNAHIWNQALMDLGAMICTAANPKCGICPVMELCPSSFRVKRNFPDRSHAEPSRNGLPNRIYRGRIIEILRYSVPKESIPIGRLGRKIKESFSDRDKTWLVQIMKDLERDGLVSLKNSRSGLSASLPS